MLTSGVSSKGEVTLPIEVRKRLDVHEGDILTYDLDPDGAVRIRKARTFDADWHRALESTLSDEWNSPEDDEAFAGLQDPS